MHEDQEHNINNIFKTPTNVKRKNCSGHFYKLREVWISYLTLTVLNFSAASQHFLRRSALKGKRQEVLGWLGIRAFIELSAEVLGIITSVAGQVKLVPDVIDVEICGCTRFLQVL